MSSTIGAVLLTVSLTAGVSEADRPALPQPVIQAGLKKAQCSVPPNAAEIVGTEMLSPRLQIVEVTCWQADYNSGSILFAVPVGRPAFKAGWGCLAAPGGFDSRSLPPSVAGLPASVALPQHCARKPLSPLALRPVWGYGLVIERAA